MATDRCGRCSACKRLKRKRGKDWRDFSDETWRESSGEKNIDWWTWLDREMKMQNKQKMDEEGDVDKLDDAQDEIEEFQNRSLEALVGLPDEVATNEANETKKFRPFIVGQFDGGDFCSSLRCCVSGSFHWQRYFH